MRGIAVAIAACAMAACAAPHVRKPVEEEPFVLSPGPPPSVREALAAKAERESARKAAREAAREAALDGSHEVPRDALGDIPPDPLRGPRHAVSGEAPRDSLSSSFKGEGPHTGILRIGRGRRVPLVHATIATKPTLMLIDTGAYDHLLEGWFAYSLQDAESSGRTTPVLDHASRVVALDQLRDLSFAIDGWTPLPAMRPLVSNDVNRGPRTFGIGGILAPQKLATDGAVVLDFPGDEMLVLEPTRARARLVAHNTALGVAPRCGNGYLIPAKVDGRDAQLLVDTGAYTTDLKITSPAGKALSGRSSISWDVYSVGGPVTARMVSDTPVKVGQLATRLDIPIVDDRKRLSRCPNDGVLGMDVLADCVLVIEPMEMRISCN